MKRQHKIFLAETLRSQRLYSKILSFSLEIYDIIHRFLVNNLRYQVPTLRALRPCVPARVILQTPYSVMLSTTTPQKSGNCYHAFAKLLEKPAEKLTSFEKWSLFFKFADDPVHRSEINAIIKDSKEIEMAATILREISQDEHERARIRSRKMYEMDKYSDYHTAIEIGELREREKWQDVIADKDAEITRLRAELESKSK